MKKILLLLLTITCFYFNSICQDILILKNGDEIKVKVTEILPDMVKYKKWDNQKGPVYSELKANIFMVKYENGSKDVFNNNTTTTTKESNETGNSNNSNDVQKFLGYWRCNIESSGIVTKGDDLNITMAGGNFTIALYHNNQSVQNIGIYKDGKIKVTFPSLGETEITYQEIMEKPMIYFFGTQMEKSLKSSSSSAFTGIIYRGNEPALVSIVFKSIDDEIKNHEELLVNKILDLLRSNRRIKAINASGVDINKVNLHYKLQCELKTFYNSKSGDLTLTKLSITQNCDLCYSFSNWIVTVI